ncbi:hypothetical protein KCP69_10785 [Salmonella enterica subsp. enterica]|nr:hypothetical protein KCP69_10785 [Salmonella enterica subsp. enterica]
MNAVIGKAGAIATINRGEAGVTNIITKPPADHSPMTPTTGPANIFCLYDNPITVPTSNQIFTGRRDQARQLSSQSVLPAACSPARPLA